MNPFLTADYRDGRVRIGSKTYAAGAYAVHLLNQFYRNDIIALLSPIFLKAYIMGIIQEGAESAKSIF